MTVQYLIDSENVGDFWIPLLELPADQTELVVFYTRNSPHMSYDSLIRLKESDRTVTFIKCYEGTNALDFQLVSELGYRICKDEGGRFVIVTNDTGFDAAVKYWRRSKKSVKRITGKECRNLERRNREDLLTDASEDRHRRLSHRAAVQEAESPEEAAADASVETSEQPDGRLSRPTLRDAESAAQPDSDENEIDGAVYVDEPAEEDSDEDLSEDSYEEDSFLENSFEEDAYDEESEGTFDEDSEDTYAGASYDEQDEQPFEEDTGEEFDEEDSFDIDSSGTDENRESETRPVFAESEYEQLDFSDMDFADPFSHQTDLKDSDREETESGRSDQAVKDSEETDSDRSGFEETDFEGKHSEEEHSGEIYSEVIYSEEKHSEEGETGSAASEETGHSGQEPEKADAAASDPGRITEASMTDSQEEISGEMVSREAASKAGAEKDADVTESAEHGSGKESSDAAADSEVSKDDSEKSAATAGEGQTPDTASESDGKTEGQKKQTSAKKTKKSAEPAGEDQAEEDDHQADGSHRSKSRRSRTRRMRSGSRKQDQPSEAERSELSEEQDKGSSRTPASDVSTASSESARERKETAVDPMGAGAEPGDEEIARIVACIGAENLAELHNQLATFYGEQGKDIYLSLKNNSRSIPVLKPDLRQKFAYYCEIIFARSDYTGEYPSDISEYLLNVREKLNNLNSLRYALQKQYGKEKGRRFYFILKPFAKTMYQM